jgi:hypothetical protein
MTTNTSLHKFVRKYWWETGVVFFSLLGISFGIFWGFPELDYGNRIYETVRLFLLNHEFYGKELSWQLEITRWSIFIAFMLVAWKLVITVIAPKWFQLMNIKFRYKNHIVICGLNEISMELIRKYAGKQMLVITNENNSYIESLKQRKIKVIIGNPADEEILYKTKVLKASHLYAITNSDKENAEIAQSAFLYMKQNVKKVEATLKCYVLIQDRSLKNILEDTALFKYTVTKSEKFFFDAILFNINEIGIKYGISMNIEKILSKPLSVVPEILIVGLTDATENIILNLAHCTTMNRANFHFTIVENDAQLIQKFQQNYAYLEDFTQITFAKTWNIGQKNPFSSIFIGAENQLNAIKQAISIRYALRDNQPNILVFCYESDHLNDLFNEKGEKVFPLEDRNIYLINTFQETVKYIIDLDDKFEKMAEMAHNIWRKKDENGQFMYNDTYNLQPLHFKQSNRNVVLDIYLKTYIATNETFNPQRQGKLITIFDEQRNRETLAIIEHRRWMIEKYNNGWRYGIKRDDPFKIHPDLLLWGKLPKYEEKDDGNAKNKDFKIIKYMETLLNKPLV